MIFLDLVRDFLYTIIDVLYFIIENFGFTENRLIRFQVFPHKIVIKFPCSWGVSGALYLQSATAGVMVDLGVFSCEAALGKWR